MALVRTVLALLLAGTLILAACALAYLACLTWISGQWWWTLTIAAALSLFAWIYGRGEKGEERKDFGI